MYASKYMRVTLLYLLAALGVIGLVQRSQETVRLWRARNFRWPMAAQVPNSILPGPSRTTGAPDFQLSDENAERMTGRDAPEDERWADIAGNHYSGAFIARFRYAPEDDPDAPVVRLRYELSGPTLRGRIEARGLKPNFAYQIKLRGDFARDPAGAEAIGYQGRWRLPEPARQTNFTDRDFRDFTPREQVESYLLFDFFVTDHHGNAAREFELDSTLHVLWNRDRQRRPDTPTDAVAYSVAASDPAVYARPKSDPSLEHIWAERVHRRYRRANQRIRLPAGHYQAEIVLTEESLHARGRDGGFWATVYALPVAFEIAP